MLFNIVIVKKSERCRNNVINCRNNINRKRQIPLIFATRRIFLKMNRIHNSDLTLHGYRQNVASQSIITSVFVGGGVSHSFTANCPVCRENIFNLAVRSRIRYGFFY